MQIESWALSDDEKYTRTLITPIRHISELLEKYENCAICAHINVFYHIQNLESNLNLADLIVCNEEHLIWEIKSNFVKVCFCQCWIMVKNTA